MEKLCPLEKKIINASTNAIRYIFTGKNPLIVGSVLMGIATLLGIANNFESFHSWYDNCWLWNEFNEGLGKIVQNSKTKNPWEFPVSGRIRTINGVIENCPTVVVTVLMENDRGFKEIKYHIVKNLVRKPNYEINAIINEQIFSRGEVENPYLSTRIISLIPVPSEGKKYASKKDINEKAYSKRKEVITENLLYEWIMSHKKRTVFSWCIGIFLIGFYFKLWHDFWGDKPLL